MDGRGGVKLSVLLLLAAGCQHQVMTVPNPGPLASSGKSPVIDPGQIKPASTKPKDLPAQVWVSCGDFKAGEASASDVEPDRRQHIRDLARGDYEQALKIDRKCVPAHQGLARLYSAMRDTPLAIETYQKTLKIAPGNASLWYELGMCHNSQKEFGPALECLRRAAQIDPGNRSIVNAMGVVLAETGRYDESLKWFSRSGGEAQGYYRLARTLQRLQQPELSQRYLEVALEKDPSLASSVARATGRRGSSTPATAVEQTAYQAPAACTAPAAPPANTPEDASAETPAAQQVILPPPPSVQEQYERPHP